jgi:hypothetical protein
MTVSICSFSEGLHSPHLPVKEIALKEWAVCIEALSKGEQLILVRKGGIMEETREFRLEEQSFYLYPTYEHQRAELMKPAWREALKKAIAGRELPPKEVTITHLAHVTDDIAVKDEAEILQRLDPYHILTNDYAKVRLHWQPSKPLHLLVVRVYQLSTPRTIRVVDEYLGCKSWLHVQEKFDGLDLLPVLPDEVFAAKRQQILDAAGVKRTR